MNCHNNYGKAILIGYRKCHSESIARLGIEHHEGMVIMNASNTPNLNTYIDHLYSRDSQRQGFLYDYFKIN